MSLSTLPTTSFPTLNRQPLSPPDLKKTTVKKLPVAPTAPGSGNGSSTKQIVQTVQPIQSAVVTSPVTPQGTSQAKDNVRSPLDVAKALGALALLVGGGVVVLGGLCIAQDWALRQIVTPQGYSIITKMELGMIVGACLTATGIIAPEGENKVIKGTILGGLLGLASHAVKGLGSNCVWHGEAGTIVCYPS